MFCVRLKSKKGLAAVGPPDPSMKKWLATGVVSYVVAFRFEFQAPAKAHHLAIKRVWAIQDLTNIYVLNGIVELCLAKNKARHSHKKKQYAAAKNPRADRGVHNGDVYVMLTSVYVPYTCRKASQISPTVA